MVDVRLLFPVGGEFSPRIDNLTVLLNRNPAVFPIVGDTSTGDARFLWVDFGLGQMQLRLEGAMRSSDVAMKPLEQAFVRSWRMAMAETSDSVDRSKVVQALVHDPRVNDYRTFYCLPRRFERYTQGGVFAWYYRMEFDIIIPPFYRYPSSFRTNKLLGETVGLEFPTGFTWIPSDKYTIVVNRQPAVVPLVGDTDTGAPNFFFTDLGLTEVDLQIMGLLPDTMGPDPFDLLSAMLSAWTQFKAGDNMRGDEISRAVRVVMECPEGTIIYRTIPRGATLTRMGQTARWEYRLEFSVVELNA